MPWGWNVRNPIGTDATGTHRDSLVSRRTRSATTSAVVGGQSDPGGHQHGNEDRRPRSKPHRGTAAIIDLRSVAADSKHAEQAYLERARTERWEHVKPFSSPGYDDVEEGARLIHDFAVALLCLEPKPGEHVLDLGAGSCWVSEWLRRFNVETVSVDIALDMLRVGQSRLGSDARVVVGDLEALPLATESVDKAVVSTLFITSRMVRWRSRRSIAS